MKSLCQPCGGPLRMPKAAICSGIADGAFCTRRSASSAPIIDVRAGEIRAARVGAELTLAREPGDDHAGEDAEHDLRDDHREHVADACATLVLENDAVDDDRR